MGMELSLNIGRISMTKVIREMVLLMLCSRWAVMYAIICEYCAQT